jgi:TolB protein
MLLLCLAAGARAELTIQITQGMEGAAPIAIVPFAAAGPLPADVAAVVAADLERSGRFAPLPVADMLERPSDGAQVDFKNWRMLGQHHLVVGQVLNEAGGYMVQFQLFDVYQGGQLLALRVPAGSNELRRAAHHIADLIYEKLTGERGAFNTRIAYVTASGGGDARRYTLMVADADGHSPQTILRSKQPIMSPSWSPDGRRLAYVSFERRRSEIYVQEVGTGSREAVASHDGINGAPAWSPDGRRLALTLSRGGNPDIYVLDLGSRALTRITDSSAIDTEPTWSPEGASLAFTSDRGGRPQIYRASSTGGGAQRLTFEGDYNARPVFSADGKRLAMVHRGGSGFTIAVLDLATRALTVLSEGGQDESPSFAPNGSMVIYASGGVLAAASVDGRVRQRLTLTEGDVREPAWSPYQN